MASTRKIQRIILRMDEDTQEVTTVEILGTVTTVDSDNVDVDFTVQDHVVERYQDMTAVEQQAVDDLLANLVTPVLTKKRPIM